MSDEKRILDIVNKEGTPLLIFSKNKIEEEYKRIEKAFAPGTELIYPIKTNPLSGILTEVAKLGGEFLMSSENEVKSCKKIKNLEKSMFYSPFCEPKELEFAEKNGVGRYVIASERDLRLVNPTENKQIFLNINLKNSRQTRDYQKPYFGFRESELKEIVNKHGGIEGLHCHLGTQNSDIEDWREFAERMYDLALEVGVNYVDLGGGFPVEYGNVDPLPIEDIGGAVREANKNDIKTIIEPGRLLVASSGSLVTKVMGVEENIAYVNASLYNCFLDTMLIGLELPVKRLQYTGSNTKSYRIKGKSLCSMDVFSKNVELETLHEGDLLVFENAGAYSHSMATEFSGFGKPKTAFV